MAEYHILNLGAGVQSTKLYLAFLRGEITPQIDCAIFADTQEEPGAVYRHLEWLKSLGGPEILTRTAGKLGDDLVDGASGRFSSIPAFTTDESGKAGGMTRRQCSRDYKLDVVERTIRREVLGLRPGRAARGVRVHQYFGISLDEAGRSRRIAERLKGSKWLTPKFPLVEQFWTRADCLTYLADKVPHQTPRSACVFCPYHSDAEWWALKNGPAEDWNRAVEVDRALRLPGSRVNVGMKRELYLHRSCQPLDLVQFDTRPTRRDLQMSMSFAQVCEGVCGV